MRTYQFSLICILTLFFNLIIITSNSFAGIFSSDDSVKIGLDFNRGYDVNTVSSFSGKVTSLPRTISEKQNVLLEIKSGNEVINISVGPNSFWDKKGVQLKLNDQITVKGSKAQGLDGKSYILARKLVNITSGTNVDIRNDAGEPVWLSKTSNSVKSEPTSPSMRNQGSFMRGSGGGAMMRR